MKMPRSIIYKPSKVYNDSKIAKEATSEKTFSSSLKKFLKELLIKVLLFGLTFLNLLSLIGVSYKGYVFLKYKIEKRTLEEENRRLNEEYKRLTSQDVLLEKAKSLNLRAPQEEDFLRIVK